MVASHLEDSRGTVSKGKSGQELRGTGSGVAEHTAVTVYLLYGRVEVRTCHTILNYPVSAAAFNCAVK